MAANWAKRFGVVLVGATLLGQARTVLAVDGCVTQSQMTAAQRDPIVTAARGLAQRIVRGDVAGLKAAAIPEIANDFAGITDVIGNMAPKVAGASLILQSVWLLDATALKPGADGTPQDAQFFCSLNGTAMETNFIIPGLPPGMYAFAVVQTTGPNPWNLSVLMREDQGVWKLAGFYPQALNAAGHDGLWYWRQAREYQKLGQHWNAWLYYAQAADLMRPAPFITTTHMDKLIAEQATAAPPVLSHGVSADTPLVVRGPNNVEYRVIALGTDDSLSKEQVDAVVHWRSDAPPTSPAAARANNVAVATALLTAYPELRKAFHGIWVFAEVNGQAPFATEHPMEELH